MSVPNRKAQQIKKRVVTLVSATAVIIFLIALGMKIREERFFPLKHIKMTGNYTHVNQHQLKAVLLPYRDQGFFEVDLASIRDELLTISWIENVRVGRLWPDTLLINLQEKSPVARWKQNGLFSEKGVYFDVKNNQAFSLLPLLNASEDNRAKAYENFELFSRQLSPLGLTVKELNEDSSQAWMLTLNTGTVLKLGQDDLSTKMNEFIRAFPSVFSGQIQNADYVDLRYANGFAVRWKNGNVDKRS